MGSRIDEVVTASSSQCVQSANPELGVMCGLSLSLVPTRARLPVSIARFSGFLSQTLTFRNFNSIYTLRRFPLNIRPIKAKIKLPKKYSWHGNILNKANKSLSRLQLSSWPRMRKLNLKLPIFY